MLLRATAVRHEAGSAQGALEEAPVLPPAGFTRGVEVMGPSVSDADDRLKLEEGESKLVETKKSMT